MPSKKILSGEGDVLFVAIQTGLEQPTKPLSSGTVFLTATPTLTHKPREAENKELRRTRDPQPGKNVGMSIGDFKFSTNFALSGSKGVTSCIHPFLLSGFGRYTETPGDNVTYTHYQFDDEWVYLTVLWKKESETILLEDFVVDTLTIKSTAATLQTIDFSGYFLKKKQAGTGYLNAALTTGTTNIVLKTKTQIETFEIGSLINIGTDTNSGEGFQITAVDISTNTLTVDTGITIAQDADALVTGWSPVEVASGYTVDGGFGEFLVNQNSDGAGAVQIISADYTLKNNIAKLEEERGSSSNGGYVGRFGTGKREITFNTEQYLTIDGLSADYHLKNNSVITTELNMGEEEGKTAKLIIPNMRLSDVSESGDAQKKQSRQGKCFPDAGDDASSLVLR